MTASALAPGRVSFHLRMAIACLAIAPTGFIATFFAPLVQGTFHRPPVFYLHGLIFFAWPVFFCLQTWLIAKGRLTAHREWGVAGAALATAMFISVFILVVVRLNQAVPEPEGKPGSPTFAWIDVGGMLFFGGCIVAALAITRRPPVHKRLMLIANVALLGAPTGRLGGLAGRAVNDLLGLGEFGPIGLIAGLLVILIPIELMIVALLMDRRPDGKLSRVYLGGIAAAIPVISPLAVAIAATPFALTIADWLKALPN